MNENKIVKELLLLTNKAAKKNEVPVACIIVKNDKIVSKAHNLRESRKNPLYHAEFIAIKKACKRLKTWKLNECIMYVTLKPCTMCEAIINESRLKEVIYYIEKNNKKIVKTPIKKSVNSIPAFEEVLTNFFRKIR